MQRVFQRGVIALLIIALFIPAHSGVFAAEKQVQQKPPVQKKANQATPERKFAPEQAQLEDPAAPLENGAQKNAPAVSVKPLSLKGFNQMVSPDLFTGQAGFSYPIFVPPGRNGGTPQLNVSYSSFNTTRLSPYGYGFDIPFHTIYRMGNYGVDQFYTKNNFAVKLNGGYNELVQLDVAGAEYAGKLSNDFTRYRKEGDHWVAVDARGTTYIFGDTQTARQYDPSRAENVFQWLLTSSKDLNGNTIKYYYTQDHNQVYFDTIEYAFNESGNTPVYRVLFHYVPKTNAGISYATQFSIETFKALSSVEAQWYANGKWNEARTLNFAYDSLDIPTPKLIAIQESAGVARLPMMEFSYYTSGVGVGLLKSIDNGQGGVIEFEYAASTSYKNAQGGLNPLPFVVKTLRAITRRDAITGVSGTQTMAYTGGSYYVDYANIYGREYAGFNRVEVTDPFGNKTMTFFHQSERAADNNVSQSMGEFDDHISKKGKAYRQEWYNARGQLLKRIITRWDKALLEGKNRNLVTKGYEVEMTWDGGKDHRDTAVSYAYDSYGNILQQIQWGEVKAQSDTGVFTDIGTDTRIATYSYAYNISLNILGAVSRVAQENGGKKQEELRYYDDMPLGQIAIGNRTKTEQWLDTENRYIASTSTYTKFGLVRSRTDALGRTTLYEYDDALLYPIAEINPLVHRASYTYAYQWGQLQQVRDPNNVITQYDFDSFGRIIRAQKSDNTTGATFVPVQEMEYLDKNKPSAVYTQKIIQPGVTQSAREFFDGFGRLMQSRQYYNDENRWFVKSIEYDELGRVKKEFIPIPSPTPTYEKTSQSDSEATLITYDGLSRVIEQKTSIGARRTVYDKWSVFTLDENNHVVRRYRDAYNQLVRMDEFTPSGLLTTTYDHDAFGNLARVTDSERNVRNFGHDSLMRLVTNEMLHKSNVSPAVYSYAYDSVGNKLRETKPDGTVISWQYDALNRMVLENDGNVTNGIEIQYVYDTALHGIGKPSQIQTPYWEMMYGYDPHGNRAVERQVFYTQPVQLAQKMAPSLLAGNGEMWQKQEIADGKYVWSGGCDDGSCIQRNGAQVVVLGMPVTQKSNEFTVKATLTMPVPIPLPNVSYSSVSSSGVSVPMVFTRIQGKDRLYVNGFFVGERSAESNSTHFSQLSITMPKDIKLELLQGVKITQVAIANFGVNNPNELNQENMIKRAPSQEWARPYTTKYGYNNFDTLMEIGYPDDVDKVNYSYNSFGLPVTVAYNGQPIVKKILYAAHGQSKYTEYANGVISTSTYDIDSQYRLSRIKTHSASINITVQDSAYSYDAVGNITKIIDTGVVAPKEATYRYDTLNRLFQASIKADNKTITEAYTYSPTGNILTKNGIGKYEYANPRYPQAVTKAGLTSYGYDANGNLTTLNGRLQYAYDYKDRMTEVSLPNTQTYTYRYDNTYNRAQKIFSDGLVRNYIGELAEAETRNGGITYLNFHFFAQGARVATTGTNGLHYNTHDHLGSTKAVTSPTGVIEQKLDYLPFGAERVSIKADGFDTRFTYTDQEKDAESGLLYYGARYYDPVIGRFTQMDPVVMNATSVLANPQFLNSYAYSLNNPIRYIDPNGKSPLEVMGGGIVGFVQGAWGTVKWGANAFVLNPIGTAGPTVAMLEGTGQGIRDFVADPIGEGNKRAIQIGSGVAMAGGWYWNASDYERGVVLGGVIEKIGEASVMSKLFSGLRGGSAVDDVAGGGKGIHGNSLQYPGEVTGYSLRDIDTLEVLKYGETSNPAQRYTQKFLDEHNAFLYREVTGSKVEMHNWQHEQIIKYKEVYNGNRPVLNKSDW